MRPIVNVPEEDRATDIINMHKKFGKDRACDLGDILSERQTHRWTYHHHTATVLRPFFRDYPGEPMPEENFWTSWCKGRLTEADILTIRLGATPSGVRTNQRPPPPSLHTDRHTHHNTLHPLSQAKYLELQPNSESTVCYFSPSA